VGVGGPVGLVAAAFLRLNPSLSSASIAGPEGPYSFRESEYGMEWGRLFFRRMGRDRNVVTGALSCPAASATIYIRRVWLTATSARVELRIIYGGIW
jgi:hypothetical protein